jgi:hypothetical protein
VLGEAGLRSVIVNLHIPPDEYQRLYAGAARDVHAHSIDGRSIRFPANILRPFVTHSGVSGTFAIYFSNENRFVKIERI